MSSLMAEFFANMIPYVALMWALALVCFTQSLLRDFFDRTDLKHLYAPLSSLLFVALFLILPIRTCLNRCCKSETVEAEEKYDEIYHTFHTDYDCENPVTKKDGMKRMMERKIAMATGEDKQKLMV